MSQDFAARFAALEERVRRLETRRKGHTETKTFLAENAIEAGRYIGPFTVGIDLDGWTPEWKILYGFPGGKLRVGTCTLQWLLNDIPIGDTQDVTTTSGENPVMLDPPVDLAAGDELRPSIVAASVDAADLAAPVFMITAAA
jgi:hypothetical protein